MDTEVDLETLEKVVDISTNFVINYGFQVFGALIILIIGWFIARWCAGLALKLCHRANLDVTLAKFFSDIVKILILAFVLIIALGKFGITIAPFIAALGAVAFGGTLALQGPLSNYGAGMTIILTRPFVVGNTIRIQGVTGIVEEVKLAYTMLSTEDGEIITIPNKLIVGEILHNSGEYLICEACIGIAYDANADEAINLVRRCLEEHAVVSKDPAPQAGIRNFADSAIEIGYRYWVPTRRYYETVYQVNKEVLESFHAAGIDIPFPQRDLHIVSQSGPALTS